MTKEQYHLYYKHTVKRKATQMWQDIKSRVAGKTGRSFSYKNIELCMTRDEFINWVSPQLEKWKERYGNLTDVSLDRKDNSKNYELDNLQLLTKYENTIKRSNNKNVIAPEGKAWCCYCKIYLETDNFHKLKSSYNGLAKMCKSCASKKQKEFRLKRRQETI